MKADFTQNLLEWNDFHNSRALPWKGETNPYKVWLSEIILQQTRVEQGLAYYQRFIEKYPDIHYLAKAPDEEVYKLWEGLGYYSRCKNLIETARLISASHHGHFPNTYAEILKLKGIGPYTAAAIASFAFKEKRAVVDGNVQRVLSRYFGITTPVDTTEGKKLFSGIAQALIDENAPAAYNQAIMDFGATICKPRNPLCNICVQADDCEAFRNNFVNDVPVKQKVMKIKTRWLYYFIIETNDGVYIRKREEKDIWQNLHEFVLLESHEEITDPHNIFLGKLLQHQSYKILSRSDVHTQQLTHQRINGRFYRVGLTGKISLGKNYKYVKKINLHGYAFPRFINSYLEKEFY
ncbi:MAG: A/G-specific adenine glycosylase [Chitinophagaceae bacterium]|nr:A/G-specific adenine glycosylase [Chitinophagaceae bacterium]